MTDEERMLIAWMLRELSDRRFMEQLANARVVSGCDCGCASINLEIDGYPPPTGGLRIIGDYLFGEGDSVQGAFVFEQGGVLSGLEVCGYGTDVPVRLPLPSAIRPWKDSATKVIFCFHPPLKNPSNDGLSSLGAPGQKNLEPRR